MKKLIITAFIFLLYAFKTYSQNFIEVQEYKVVFGKKYIAKIDTGNGQKWIKTESGKRRKFASSMDIFNWMSQQDYTPYCVEGFIFLFVRKENEQ